MPEGTQGTNISLPHICLLLLEMIMIIIYCIRSANQFHKTLEFLIVHVSFEYKWTCHLIIDILCILLIEMLEQTISL